jgi:uncharacterized protein GlcG (DUF336 family)
MAVQSENERNKAVVDEYVAAWGGGFPIKVNGEVVGAIGLSGAPAVQNDVDCAKAAPRAHTGCDSRKITKERVFGSDRAAQSSR